MGAPCIHGAPLLYQTLPRGSERPLLPIHQISLPTPWPAVGPVHVYVIRQDPVTLIDTGLHTPESREALDAGLREIGLTVRDIRRVLLTHAHLDHMGEAAAIVEASGAEIFLHADEVGKADSPAWWLEGRERVLAENGASAEERELMERYWRLGKRMFLPVDAWTPLAAGDRFAFEDGELKAVHLPGHALGHTGFLEESSRTLIGGDHLLEKVTPNPIMEPVRPGHEAAVPHDPIRALTLGQFLTALDQAAEMDLARVLPGHGPVIEDHRAVVANYKAKHERRLGSLQQRLGEGRKAWDLTREVYPRVREFDIFLALSEVLAHLDLLVVRGRVRFEQDETGSWFLPRG